MFNLVGFLKGIVMEDPADRSKQFILQISPSATTGTSTTITASQTANRNVTLPDADGGLMTPSSTDTLSNKTISGSNNTLLNLPGAQIVAGTIPATAFATVTDGVTLDQVGAGSTLEIKTGGISNAQVNAAAAIAVSKLAPLTINRALQSDASGVISASGVTSTTLAFLDATSSIQTQLNSKPTITPSLVDNHVIRADGTSAIQSSNVIIDDSGNMTGVNSISLPTGGVTIGIGSTNAISTTGSSALLLTNGGSSSQVVYTDKPFLVLSPASGLTGTIALRENQDNGGNIVTIQPVAALASDKIFTLPDITMTALGADSTQNMSNKTFTDAITLTQIATPSNPSATHDKVYIKSDDHLYILNSSGVETQVGLSTLVVQSKSANYTALPGDDVVLGTTGSAFQVTLPTAVGVSGKIYRIKKVSSDSNTLTVGTTSAQTIDGATTFPLYNQWDELSVLSNGANWDIIAYTFARNIVYSNSAFSTTAPGANDTWFNVVGNNVSLNSGSWELSCSLQYGNNGSNPGYTNKYAYWCAATGTNTATAPAALNTLAGLTVLGGYTSPYIADSSTDQQSVVIMQPLIINLTQPQTIYVGMRALTSTFANLRVMPTITAKRIY